MYFTHIVGWLENKYTEWNPSYETNCGLGLPFQLLTNLGFTPTSKNLMKSTYILAGKGMHLLQVSHTCSSIHKLKCSEGSVVWVQQRFTLSTSLFPAVLEWRWLVLLDSDPGHVLKHTGPCDNVVHTATVLFLLQREVQLQEDLGREGGRGVLHAVCLSVSSVQLHTVRVQFLQGSILQFSQISTLATEMGIILQVHCCNIWMKAWSHWNQTGLSPSETFKAFGGMQTQHDTHKHS